MGLSGKESRKTLLTAHWRNAIAYGVNTQGFKELRAAFGVSSKFSGLMVLSHRRSLQALHSAPPATLRH